MYMLDTNTLIYFFKGMGDVENNLFSHSPKEIFIPSIVIYELQVGIAKSTNPQKRQEQFATLLEQVNTIYFGEKEAKVSALIRADLEKKGTPIGPMDILIAGCAKAHNLTLVTHNTKEFMRVEALKLCDWF
ncbi:MAG TPA: type II toxin-antitoxin system VapC family toxin [Campylobacterales bacterium]|nr:type II toxin-antitoxin system VapC family toxin [Campylobacterales bacterium]